MMLVDCQTCPVRDVHCADCMVTALAPVSIPTPTPVPTPIVPRPLPALSPAPAHGPHLAAGHPLEEVDSAPLDRAERRAVSVLLAAGLVSLETANSARAVRSAPATSHRPGTRRAAV